MAARKPALRFTTAERAELNEFIARQIAPRSAKRIAAALDNYDEADLMKVIVASNLHADKYSSISGSQTPNPVGGFVSGDDVETIRIVADNAEFIRESEFSITEFHELLRTLERLEIIPLGADSFPHMKQHLKTSEYSFLSPSKSSYSRNEALILFIEENIERHDEVIAFMEENNTQDVGRLRAHFYGEALALSEGVI